MTPEHENPEKPDDELPPAVYDECVYDECVYETHDDERPASTNEAREPGFRCNEPDSRCDTDGHTIEE